MQKRTSHNKLVNSDNLHLSIQTSLDGFSFCVFNQENHLVTATQYNFSQKCATPEALLNAIKKIFKNDADLHASFTKIEVVHQNELSTIVPAYFFSEKNLKNYLTYSVKTFPTDYITYDAISSINAKNVFIPFVNINNYLLDHFGDFHFYHHHTILLEKVIARNHSSTQKVIAHLDHSLLDILVLDGKNLLLANTFEIENAEDFIYYLLFVYEQLALDVLNVPLEIIAPIDAASKEYLLAYKYIKEVRILKTQNQLINSSTEFRGSEFYLLV